MKFRIRAATKEDCKDISRMIMELAVYEKMSDQVKISHEELERDGFCQNSFFECLIAEVPEEHKSNEGFTIVGYALYFYTYSTWKGRSVYLEDLYVMPEFRGNGIGKGLLSKVAEVGKQKQCVRLQLSVLDWNTPSRDFYAAKGAQDLTTHGFVFAGTCYSDQLVENVHGAGQLMKFVGEAEKRRQGKSRRLASTFYLNENDLND